MTANTGKILVMLLALAAVAALALFDKISGTEALMFAGGVVTGVGVKPGRRAAAVVLAASGAMLIPACTAVQSPTQNRFDAAAATAESNTGQNVQIWPDGSTQSTATAPESAQIGDGKIDYQGTSLSALMHLGPSGIGVRNPGNLTADSVQITFGEPITVAEGERAIVPVTAVTLSGLRNEVTSVVSANTEQVALWVGVLGRLSQDQQAAVIAALERDKVVTEATAGAIRSALGLLVGP